MATVSRVWLSSIAVPPCLARSLLTLDTFDSGFIRIADALRLARFTAATEPRANAGIIPRKSYCGQSDAIPISTQGGWTARQGLFHWITSLLSPV